MARAFIGLGSNIGDRQAALDFAIVELQKIDGIQLIRSSSYYETDPVGDVAQDAFLNAVVELEVAISPQALMNACLNIERLTGRERTVRWGPRTLDLDLLEYGQCTMQSDLLTLPHPEATKRAFVLVPWAELAPDYQLASSSISNWLANVETGDVRPFKRHD